MNARPPTLRQFIVRAVRCGAETTDKISELVGVNPRRVARDLRVLEGQRRVRCVGKVEPDRPRSPETDLERSMTVLATIVVTVLLFAAAGFLAVRWLGRKVSDD